MSLTIARGVLRGAQGSVNGAKLGLKAAEGVLRGVEETARRSKGILDAAKAVLTAAQVTVDKSRVSLEGAKGALRGVEELTRRSQSVGFKYIQISYSRVWRFRAVSIIAYKIGLYCNVNCSKVGPQNKFETCLPWRSL